MKKKIFLSVLIALLWLFFVSLFYKTICVMLLFAVWKKELKGLVAAPYQKWLTRGVWCCLFLVLWMGIPRYRTSSGDRVRLLYLDADGTTKHPPLGQYLLNTFLPEEDIVNLGTSPLGLFRAILPRFGLGSSLIDQASVDFSNGKRHNFLDPYRNLGWENPMSGVYVQAFNETFHTDNEAVYLCNPKDYDEDKTYPLVVFFHGFLGNWKMYQGIWKDLDDAIVLSVGTKGLDGIFTGASISRIFSFYIPMLERMGYHIDLSQVHLMGLSNGGTAVMAAMHSPHAKQFKSISTISCNLIGLRRVPCQVNLIGGGKDASSSLLPSQYQSLRRMGVDAALFFDKDDNHYIVVNQRREILDFLKNRMQLTVK